LKDSAEAYITSHRTHTPSYGSYTSKWRDQARELVTARHGLATNIGAGLKIAEGTGDRMGPGLLVYTHHQQQITVEKER